MPKMTVRVILKSGVEFFIKCDKFTLTRNGFQQVTGYNIEGITENKPVYPAGLRPLFRVLRTSSAFIPRQRYSLKSAATWRTAWA